MYEQIIFHFLARHARHTSRFLCGSFNNSIALNMGCLVLKTLVAYLKVVQKTLRPTDYTAHILHTYNITSLVNFLCNKRMIISSDQRIAHLSMRCPSSIPFVCSDRSFSVLRLLVVSSSYFFFLSKAK
jgi:hypothetical protein